MYKELTVWRICMMILGCRGLNSSCFHVYCTCCCIYFPVFKQYSCTLAYNKIHLEKCKQDINTTVHLYLINDLKSKKSFPIQNDTEGPLNLFAKLNHVNIWPFHPSQIILKPLSHSCKIQDNHVELIFLLFES